MCFACVATLVMSNRHRKAVWHWSPHTPPAISHTAHSTHTHTHSLLQTHPLAPPAPACGLHMATGGTTASEVSSVQVSVESVRVPALVPLSALCCRAPSTAPGVTRLRQRIAMEATIPGCLITISGCLTTIPGTSSAVRLTEPSRHVLKTRPHAPLRIPLRNVAPRTPYTAAVSRAMRFSQYCRGQVLLMWVDGRVRAGEGWRGVGAWQHRGCRIRPPPPSGHA